MKKIVISLCVALFATFFISCGNKTQKEEAARLAAEQEQLDIQRRAEEERRAAAEEARRAEEERQRNADPFKENGWNYLRNRLKAPSTASLAGYVSPNEEPTRRLTDDLGMSGVKLAVFMVDAQNGFGAMIRTVYYVFFENGTPFAIMDESEVASSTMTQLQQYLSYARS